MLLDEWDTAVNDDEPVIHPSSGSIHHHDYSEDEDKAPELEHSSSRAPKPVETPIFRLLKQDWEPSREQGSIVSVSVGNFLMMVGTENGHVVRWDMKTEAIENLILTRKGDDKIHKLFVDPSGQHCIISCTNGNNFYINKKSSKFLPLQKWKGVVVESISWDKSNSSEISTKKILVGSEVGVIYEASIEAEKEKFKQIYVLDESRSPISGLEVEPFPGSEGGKFLIMVATPTRHYQFIGGPTFEQCFLTYSPPSKVLPKFIELPGTLSYSALQTYTAESNGAQSCAWLTGVGVFYGQMLMNSQNPGDGVIAQTKLLPFPSESLGTSSSGDDTAPAPQSLSLTEFHFLLLYPHRMLAINQLSEEVVWTLPFMDRSSGGLLGFARDVTHQCLFAFSDRGVFEIGVDREDRDVWRLYLDDGNFAQALEHCHTAEQENCVREAEADAYFAKGQFEAAARLYAQTQRSFEEVALRFVHQQARDALRIFLLTRLQRADPKKDLTQRVMLCTWLTELYLDRLNQLRDRSSGEHEQCVEEFRNFLRLNLAFLQLNRDTTFELIASHGRIDEMLYFATLIGEHERVIEHHVQRGNYQAALRALARLDDVSHDELFYKYAPMLMHFVPDQLVDLLMEMEFLDPCKLIPALMRYESAQTVPITDPRDNQAIRYLEHCITEGKNTDPAIHNYLLALYAKLPASNERALLRFIEAQGDQPHFDLKYALRLCHQEKKTRACVTLYTNMGLFEEAVKLALSPECNDLELAKRVAEMRNEDDEHPQADKKKIWLLIARHIIEQQQDISKAIAVLKEFHQLRMSDDESENSEQLKIEDILPFFPDFVKIADFKDEICDALDQYNAHIEKLKKEMDEYTQNANMIRKDITQLRNRFGYVGAGQKCDLCMMPVLSRPFLVFPCSHVFHMDCMTKDLDHHLNPKFRGSADRRSLLGSNASSEDASSSSSSLGFGFFGDSSKRTESDARTQAERERERAERERRRKLEEMAAADCLFCGEFMINSVTEAFISPDERDEIDSWAV